MIQAHLEHIEENYKKYALDYFELEKELQK